MLQFRSAISMCLGLGICPCRMVVGPSKKEKGRGDAPAAVRWAIEILPLGRIFRSLRHQPDGPVNAIL